jgi:AcrR family transcriptional regulator
MIAGVATLSRRARTAESRKANEDALLGATIGLLEDGTAYADLSIDQIVRAAGLSRPTFYAYFEDKRALVLRLGEDLERDLMETAGPWLEFAEQPAREVVAGVLDVFRRHRAVVGAITEAATYDPDVREFWHAFHERFRPGAERRVADGEPKLAKDAVAARAFALIWMTERALTEHVAEPTVDEEALVDQLTWMWQRAIGD